MRAAPSNSGAEVAIVKSRSCTCSGHLGEPQKLKAENTKPQVRSAERLPRESKALRFVATLRNEETKSARSPQVHTFSLFEQQGPAKGSNKKG